MALNKDFYKNYISDVLIQGTIDEIKVKNKEYPIKNKTPATRFKNVFSVTTIPKSEDTRFKNCISWERQVINVGDLISAKGYFRQDCFIVKGLSILRRNDNAKE